MKPWIFLPLTFHGPFSNSMMAPLPSLLIRLFNGNCFFWFGQSFLLLIYITFTEKPLKNVQVFQPPLDSSGLGPDVWVPCFIFKVKKVIFMPASMRTTFVGLLSSNCSKWRLFIFILFPLIGCLNCLEFRAWKPQSGWEHWSMKSAF